MIPVPVVVGKSIKIVVGDDKVLNENYEERLEKLKEKVADLSDLL